MVNGVHAIIYSKDAEADLAFFRDVLKFPYVDAGHGWLIFRLPPPELAIHPSSEEEKHELYLTCDDIAVFVAEMGKAGVVLLLGRGLAGCGYASEKEEDDEAGRY